MNAIRRRRSLSILVAVAAVAAPASGCGSDSKNDDKTKSVPEVVKSATAKPKVIQHGALVYGAFDHYIAAPWAAGALKAGASGRTAALKKVNAAILVIVRELGLTKQASLTDDKLRPVSVKIDDFVPRLGSLASKLAAGTATDKDISQAGDALGAVLKAAKAAGANIPIDKIPPLPPA